MSATSRPCPICREEDPNAFRIWYDAGFKLYRCRSCGFVAQYPGPGRSPLVESYEDYYSLDYLQHRTFLRQERQGVFADMAGRLAAHLAKGARLLDVGCGDGQFLSLCRQLGLSCHGVEPSRELAAYAREKTGAEVVQGTYRRELYGEASFDAVSFIQVLEHLSEPALALEAARYHLREGGLLLIEVPSLNAPRFLAYRLTGIKRFVRPPHGVTPLHIGYYSPKSLDYLTERCGFERVELVAGRQRIQRQGPLGAVGSLLGALGIGGLLYIGRKVSSGG